MTIAPIAETGMPGMMNPVSARGGKDNEKGDFMQAFNNAKDSVVPAVKQLKAEGSGAQGMDSDKDRMIRRENKVSEDRTAGREDSSRAERREDTEKSQESVQDEPLDEESMEKVSSAVAQLMQEIMDLMGGDVNLEDLKDALSQLGMEGSDLLNGGNVNQLVANLLADGDLSALLTDGELSDIASQLNDLINATVEELEGMLEEGDALKAMAPALNEALGKGPGLMEGELPKELPPEAMLPAEETQGELGMQQKPQESGSESDMGKDDERGEHERFPEEMTQQPVFAPEAQNAESIDAERMRAEMDQLRYTSNPQDIMEQVGEQIRTRVKDDMSSLEMVLHPASLGNVALNLTSKDGSVSAQFTAQSEAVRAALESQLAVLKENLEQAGVKVTSVEVTVSSHGFEQNLEQGNDGQSEAEAREQERLRRATRRIDLGEFGTDGVMGADEADALTVEMMQADGNRLDYKA